MTFFVTLSALENAIGSSVKGCNSVGCFAALSSKSLPGIFEWRGSHWMTMCVWMVFSSIPTPLTRAFRPSSSLHKDLLSVQTSTVLPMVGL